MTTAYLVLDLQNDLVHVDGPNGAGPLGAEVRSRNVIENTNTVIEKARKAGASVIFVRVGFSPDYRECSETSPMFTGVRNAGLLKLGTWGTEIHPDLDCRETDPLITKHRVSPFYGTSLEVLLRSRNVTKLVVSGVSTSAVVQACIREAHDRDYVCTVVADGCAAGSAAETETSLEILGRFAQVTTAADVTFD